MNPAVATLLAAACAMLAAGVAFGLVEQIARYLFDHVDSPGRDETAPPEDAP